MFPVIPTHIIFAIVLIAIGAGVAHVFDFWRHFSPRGQMVLVLAGIVLFVVANMLGLWLIRTYGRAYPSLFLCGWSGALLAAMVYARHYGTRIFEGRDSNANGPDALDEFIAKR